MKRHWQLYCIIFVPVCFLVVFHYIPMAGLQIAFKEYNPLLGMWGSPWVGMKYFGLFYHSPFFWTLIQNTLAISIYSLVISTPVTIVLALALNEVRHRWFKQAVQTVTYAPYFISTVVLAGMIHIFLDTKYGLINQVYRVIGHASVPNVLGEAGWFSSLYVWSGVWQETGYGAIIYLAALTGVNPELHEAAKIDGASIFQKMKHIDVPAILPTIIVLFILAIGNVMGVGFEKVFLLQNPLNLSQSEVISTYVYKIGLIDGNISFAVVTGLFNSVVGLVMISGANFLARKYSDSSLF